MKTGQEEENMNTGQTLQQGKMEIISPFLWYSNPEIPEILCEFVKYMYMYSGTCAI
jgi:hypothetical protein